MELEIAYLKSKALDLVSHRLPGRQEVVMDHSDSPLNWDEAPTAAAELLIVLFPQEKPQLADGLSTSAPVILRQATGRILGLPAKLAGQGHLRDRFDGLHLLGRASGRLTGHGFRKDV
jgi:hypothetical protein